MKARISISATLLVMVLTGCTSTHSDFKRAQSLNTIPAYQSFLDAHPDSQYANQARTRIAELRRQQEEAERLRRERQAAEERQIEHLSWDRTLKRNTIEAYQEFLQAYPQSEFTAEANLRIEKLTGESKLQPSITVAEGSSNPNKIIPDDSPIGINDTISISEDLSTERVHIEVDASELSNLDDLEVTLISPKGTTGIFLKPHSIGGRIYPQPGARVRFRKGEGSFVGETSKGSWKLTVKDLIKGNTGTLKSWTIKIFSEK